MRRSLVAGNWKMNGDKKNIATLVAGLLDLECKADVIVFPPYVYIPQVLASLSDTVIAVGAQNVSERKVGAYTGEVSSEMLRDIGCQYCLVGHSERRSLYGENDRQVAEKFYQAQLAGLKPILCLGETLKQREQGETLGLISAQIDTVLDCAGVSCFSDAIVAYEPIWAIGTGKSAAVDQIQLVHQYIREKLGEFGAKTRILYGGSVTPANTAELLSQADIDGILVGGASLDIGAFSEMCQMA